MTRLRWFTAGESHGPALVGILEGLPAGLELLAADLDRDLARRQLGYGRGGRMKIEKDRARILGGVRHGQTLGGPLAVLIENLDFANWQERMAAEPLPEERRGPRVTVPRPGHADLAGALKYGRTRDLRDVLERASARETATRVALGGAAKRLLAEAGIRIGSCVAAIRAARARPAEEIQPHAARYDAAALAEIADRSPVRTVDPEAEPRMIAEIDAARERRDTVGGVVEVRATGVPPGLGSYVQWDRRLDARLGAAFLSVQAFKAAEIGEGWSAAGWFGSETHDAIVKDADGRLARARNHAGGVEGGVTNGEPVVVRAAMKPLSTVPAALPSVDLATGEPAPAHVERTDTCAVPAAAIVGEAMMALVLADALLEKFGGDSLHELRRALRGVRGEGRTIYLCGMMGSGKTTVGRLLAERLGCRFVDLDAEVEREAGATVSRIFEEKGEGAFRDLESRMVEAAAVDRRPATSVVALGGGALGRAENRAALRASGLLVYLRVSPEVAARRVGAEGTARPMLGGAQGEVLVERLRELLRAREPLYREADLAVNADPDDPRRVVEAILAEALLTC